MTAWLATIGRKSWIRSTEICIVVNRVPVRREAVLIWALRVVRKQEGVAISPTGPSNREAVMNDHLLAHAPGHRPVNRLPAMRV